MYRTYSEWAGLAWSPAEWWRLSCDPTEWMRMGSDFMSCGMTSGRRFYGRRAEIEALEAVKKRLEDEIADIDDRIDELKGAAAAKKD